MKSIRKISLYERSIRDTYYVSDSGTIYVARNDRKVMKDDERRTVTKHMIKQAMALNQEWYVPFNDWGMYCLVLKDGTVVRRLSTFIKDNEQVAVALTDINDVQKKMYVSRIVANTFISDVTNMEVHHKDRDRKNNHVSNLEVLTFEEHRGKDIHELRHPRATTIPTGSRGYHPEAPSTQ